MHGRWNNFLATFNQLALLVCVYHLVCFTDWLDREEQYLCGFSLLYWVAFFILVNLLYIVGDLMRLIGFVIVYYAEFILMVKNWFKKIWYYLLAYIKWIGEYILYYLKFLYNSLRHWFKSCLRKPKFKLSKPEPISLARPRLTSLEVEEEFRPIPVLKVETPKLPKKKVIKKKKDPPQPIRNLYGGWRFILNAGQA